MIRLYKLHAQPGSMGLWSAAQVRRKHVILALQDTIALLELKILFGILVHLISTVLEEQPRNKPVLNILTFLD